MSNLSLGGPGCLGNVHVVGWEKSSPCAHLRTMLKVQIEAFPNMFSIWL